MRSDHFNREDNGSERSATGGTDSTGDRVKRPTPTHSVAMALCDREIDTTSNIDTQYGGGPLHLNRDQLVDRATAQLIAHAAAQLVEHVTTTTAQLVKHVTTPTTNDDAAAMATIQDEMDEDFLPRPAFVPDKHEVHERETYPTGGTDSTGDGVKRATQTHCVKMALCEREIDTTINIDTLYDRGPLHFNRGQLVEHATAQLVARAAAEHATTPTTNDDATGRLDMEEAISEELDMNTAGVCDMER